jgi:hypothetical protein
MVYPLQFGIATSLKDMNAPHTLVKHLEKCGVSAPRHLVSGVLRVGEQADAIRRQFGGQAKAIAHAVTDNCNFKMGKSVLPSTTTAIKATSEASLVAEGMIDKDTGEPLIDNKTHR